jgi:hypothetical protein
MNYPRDDDGALVGGSSNFAAADGIAALEWLGDGPMLHAAGTARARALRQLRDFLHFR